MIIMMIIMTIILYQFTPYTGHNLINKNTSLSLSILRHKPSQMSRLPLSNEQSASTLNYMTFWPFSGYIFSLVAIDQYILDKKISCLWVTANKYSTWLFRLWFEYCALKWHSMNCFLCHFLHLWPDCVWPLCDGLCVALEWPEWWCGSVWLCLASPP